MKIIGHRGAKGLAPENTLAGIAKALEHHVDAIEIDVRVTKDMVPVLEHDSHTSDAGGQKLVIRLTKYSELKAHKPSQPTLAEALEFLNMRVPIIIEIKPGEPTAPVIAVVRKALQHGYSSENLSFISFDFNVLQQVHVAFPGFTVIMNDKWSSIRLVARAKKLDTKDVALWAPFLWSGVIRGLTKRGYRVLTSPINTVAKAKRWETAGLAGFCTDYPDLFEK